MKMFNLNIIISGLIKYLNLLKDEIKILIFNCQELNKLLKKLLDIVKLALY